MTRKEDYREHEIAESVTRCVSIDQLTEGILTDFETQLESNNIRVDKDLPNFSADVYPRFIHAAVCQLIENAIQQMPSGGELNVTLIEGERCWELEVADSLPNPQMRKHNSPTALPHTMLPRIAGIEPDLKLEVAQHAADLHGGHVQSWDCPQGGTANVLVIPRQRDRHKAA